MSLDCGSFPKGNGSVSLIGRDAGRSLETSDLVYPDPIVADPRIEIFANVCGEVLCRRVEFFIERRKFVQIPVIQVVDDLVGRVFQIAKVDEQSDIVQLRSAGVDLDLVVVSVQILAFSLVTAQLMRG